MKGTPDIDPKIKKENGITAVKYYYCNNPVIGNIYTVCVLLSDKKILARGVSICSLNDSHVKTIAREQSKKRALMALFAGYDQFEIFPDLSYRTYIIAKRFKCKDENQKKQLIKDIKSSGFDFFDREYDVTVYIPYNYPLCVAVEEFPFKSSPLPTPTEKEKVLYRL